MKSILLDYGVPSGRDNIIADGGVLADLRSVNLHGMNHLPSYIARIKVGVLATNSVVELEYKTPVLATLEVT